MPNDSHFGVRLRQLREAAGMTQAELSAKSGLGQNSISNWEQGIRQPSWPNVVALCAALDVDCRSFLDTPAPEPPKPKRRRPS